MNRTIRARIHESAVKRVTRIYAATLADIFAETLQNSRRAAATRVRLAVTAPPGQPGAATAGTGDTPFTVTIVDDGSGIADPGRAAELRRERLGRGAGPARRRSRLRLRQPGAPQLRRLLAAAFAQRGGCTRLARRAHARALSRGDGRQRPGRRALRRIPHGTAISFRATESVEAIRSAAETAARHYPLPVIFNDGTDAETAGKKELPRRAFLDGAVHAESMAGSRLRRLPEPSHRLQGPGPQLLRPHPRRSACPRSRRSTAPTWTVLADVDDCPDLELVLPARKEAVENAFLKEMRAAARLAIYRAMSAYPEPRPAFEDWSRAREAGIDIDSAAGRAAALEALGCQCRRLARPAEARRHRPASMRLVMDCDPGAARGAGAVARRRTGRFRAPPVRGRPPARRLRLVRRARPHGGRP